jgi:hypothetical protein
MGTDPATDRLEEPLRDTAVAESPGEEVGTPAGGPLLALVARGLEFWLRQQCDAIEQLDIRMEGSAARLLRGRLEGVHLVARGVVFQQLEFEAVELRSEAIRLRMGALLRRQTVELENPFRIQGEVAFTGEGLSRSLASPAWHSFGDDLAEELMGLAPLSAVRITGDHLVFSTSPPGAEVPLERAVRLNASETGLVLHPLDEGPALTLPIDPDIRIEQALVGGGRVTLQGEAKVQP